MQNLLSKVEDCYFVESTSICPQFCFVESRGRLKNFSFLKSRKYRQWRIQNFIMGGADGREGEVWGGGTEKNLNFYLKMVDFGAF